MSLLMRRLLPVSSSVEIITSRLNLVCGQGRQNVGSADNFVVYSKLCSLRTASSICTTSSQNSSYYFSTVSGKGLKMTANLPEAVRQKLDQIPDVKIDESGKFKYILIKVFAKDKDGKDEDSNSKVIVRGRADCLYHGDIFDKFQEETSRFEGVDDDILGGGRIERSGNKIVVYGYSQGYGRADHAITVEILKKQYPTHDISWNNDGY